MIGTATFPLEPLADLPRKRVAMALPDARRGVVPALRGRDREIAVVRELLGCAERGQSGILLVEGAPGIGKSSVLAEARAMARRAGVRPLFGEAFESQQEVPFGPLLAATLGGDPPIGDVEAVRSLSRQPEMRYWMLHDLEEALESAALETPLAFVLDDFQWVDTGTLAALSTLPIRLSEVPILWILALRTGDCRPEIIEVAARLQIAGARRMRLDSLSEDAVGAIVSERLRAEAAPELLALAANARGNPFLLTELLDGLREEGRLRITAGYATLEGDGLPHRLADSMRERLDRLSPTARDVVRAASVLGHRFSAEQLASLLQRRPSALAEALEDLLRADLIVEVDDRLSFRHDLLRQSVLETLPRSLRRALQREAATVLLATGAAPVEVARQLAESAEPGDCEAIATLRKAAQTWAGSDVGAAADLSVHALQLMLPVDPGRGPLVAETVVLLHSAMRSEAARELGERALAGALPAEQEAEVRLSLSTMFNRSTEDRSEENRRALALPGLTPVLRARHHGVLAYNLSMSGRLDQVPAAAEAAITAASECGDGQSLVMGRLGMACADAAHGRSASALAQIEELRRFAQTRELPMVVPVLELHHIHALCALGRLDEALSLLAEGIARGRRERNAWLLDIWPQVAARIALLNGRLGDALAEAESAEKLLGQVRAGGIVSASALVALAQIAIHTGDAKRLRAAVDAAREIVDDTSPVVRRHGTWIMAMAAMEREEAAEAVRWLEDDDMPYAVPFMPADPGYQPQVARIALAAGDGELARRAVDLADAFDRACPGAPVVAAVAANTHGLVEGDSDLLVTAARALHGTQRPLLAAAACEDAGRQLAHDGRCEEAIALLGEAFDTFTRYEAAADGRRVARLLRDHGVRRRIIAPGRPADGWGSLTESELRVVRLIAAGATNREAAEQLFLSPHTVSSHLRSAFGKLGINSRIGLTRIVLREEHGADAQA